MSTKHDPAPAEHSEMIERIRSAVRDVPDFPKPGILFRDITPILADPQLMQVALDLHLAAVADLRGKVDRVVGIESRGFLFGPPIAVALGAGFVPVRKPGKLPAMTVEREYQLEYGVDTVQMHADAVVAGHKVLLVDDLLATGGTAQATASLIEGCGGKLLGCLFLIELAGLEGRARLGGHRVDALLRYD
jgi:adenine phosphoribosyltransferase